MGRRRRRRRSGSAQKTQANSAPTPQPQPERTKAKQTGRGSPKKAPPPRKPVAQQAAELTAGFPPKIEQIPEFLENCHQVRKALAGASDAGLSTEELFYFVASGIETLAEEDLDRIFDDKYRNPLQEIRIRSNLAENEYWDPDDPRIPEPYHDLLNQFRAEKRALLAKLFRKYADAGTAELIEQNYSEYVSRREEGKRRFFSRTSLDSLVLPAQEGPSESI